MRQIEAISAMLAYMLTGKKTDRSIVEEHAETHSDTDRLYRKLHILVKQGQICEAENALFAAMEESDPEVPEAAVLFYDDLNCLSDDTLIAANFSREEILDGLKAVCTHYGLPDF